MTTEEMIAQLDALERELDGFILKMRTLRHDLKQVLDNDSERVVG